MIQRFRPFSILFAGVLLLGVSCGSAKDGGVFRSLDSGDTWEQKVFISQDGRRAQTIGDMNVTTMVFHPADANIIYLGTKGNGLYVSVTGGEQWTQLSLTTGTVNSIAIDPIDSQNIYVAKGSSIYKSTDDGLTWEAIYQEVSGAAITTVIVDSFDHNRIYAATNSGTVIKSYDYGVHWDLRLQLALPIRRLLMAQHDTRILYVLTTEQQIYQTTNGGEFIDGADNINSGWTVLLTKEFKSQFENGHRVTDMVLDPNDSTVLYMVTRRGLMRGANNGTEWSDIVTLVGVGEQKNDTIKNFTVTPGNSNEFFFSLGHAIHHSTDGGETWKIIENFPSTRTITELIVDFQTPNVMYAGVEAVEKKGGLIKTR